jgi:hypothetical protein
MASVPNHAFWEDFASTQVKSRYAHLYLDRARTRVQLLHVLMWLLCDIRTTYVSSPESLESCQCKLALLSKVAKSFVRLIRLGNLPRAMNIFGYKALIFLNSFSYPSFQNREYQIWLQRDVCLAIQKKNRRPLICACACVEAKLITRDRVTHGQSIKLCAP